jgi:hypothetical protein
VEPANMVDSGSWYVSGFHWPHDGKPLETANFVVYSDAASTEARRKLADIAEDALAELKAQFGMTGNELFRFPPGQQKIHIYTYKNHFPTQWGGWAYWGGLLIYSLDHEERGEAGHTAPDMYVPVVKHEVMHVIESLLKASNNPELVDVWLTEGIAEFVSGGNAAPSITDRARFDDLIATHGRRNPIAMHRYTDYPSESGIVYNYYIPMFQLAATYLFDAQGHGATLEDLKDLYLDIREGMAFSAAFADRLGISVAEYEQQFFDLMSDYLE